MLAPNENYHSSQSGQLLSVLVGLLFSFTVFVTFWVVLAWFEQVDPEVFSVRLLIACLSSIAAFSSQQIIQRLQSRHLLASFPIICSRWFFVFMMVLLSAYVEKSSEQLSRAVMLLWLVTTPITLTVMAVFVRTCAIMYYKNPKRRRKAVLIWSNSACAELVESLRNTPLAAIDVIGFFDNRSESRPPAHLEHLGNLDDAVEWIQDENGRVKVDVVFIGLNNKEPEELAELISILEDSTASTYFVPESLIFGMPGIQLRQLAGKPVLASTETPFIGLAGLPKRLLDFFGALAGLLLLSPLLMLIALGVKLSSPGPVFFKQKRYGAAGKSISVYKFRSMRTSAPNAPVIQATVDDPRVTRFGRFLRRSSLDELPQLFNVLRGDMSLVGPRPHAVEHNELYRKLVSGYMFRHKIKPGITGWAQVNGLRGETETLEKMDLRVKYDLYYIQNWSFWLDLLIIWRTFKVVFGDKNAY